MIRIEGILKVFSKGSVSETTALDNVSLLFDRGEFVVIVGANGSGKSTLLNCIAGNVLPDAGKIIFDEKEVTSLKDYQRSLWLSRMFQNPYQGTASGLSVLDNFRLAALRTGKKKLKTGISKKFREEVKDKISLLKLGLENKVDENMENLSGGQRQALTLIMAVMDESKILLMDEPAAALDPRTASLIMEKASEIITRFNLTAILVTHNMKDAHHYGTRIIQMEEGKIKRDLRNEKKQQLSLNELYGWF
jgi:putative ABC transport system ATP-binding protein